jgi:hypothetical protein
VLAYLFWHSPAPGVDGAAYEQELERFHRSLAHRPPSGLRGSAIFRLHDRPWATDEGGHESFSPAYEDWYVLESWSAVGVLEEAAVAQGHVSAHDGVARLAGPGAGSIYRLGEGSAEIADARLAVWVQTARGHSSPTVADLLGDGMDGSAAGLWQRCLVLGPAPEYCLLAATPPDGVATARLPASWRARISEREVVWSG